MGQTEQNRLCTRVISACEGYSLQSGIGQEAAQLFAAAADYAREGNLENVAEPLSQARDLMGAQEIDTADLAQLCADISVYAKGNGEPRYPVQIPPMQGPVFRPVVSQQPGYR